ncbi:unnamed protein product, partial [Tenebrio molitor]
VAVFLVAALAVSHASIIGLGGAATLVGPGAPGAVLRGPAAHASLIGPDGSHIAAAAQAGALAAAPRPGGVVSAAVAPGAIGVGLGLGHGAVLAAPGAVVSTGLGLGLGGHGLLGAGLLGPLLAPGSGHEGQYVHDYTETLYDDGSYKGDYYEGHY